MKKASKKISKPSLHELQMEFAQSLKAPAPQLSRQTYNETEKFPLERRSSVYHYAYWVRLENSLIEDFPKLAQVLGEKSFREMTRNYLAKYPSTSPSLVELGQNLPQFLRLNRPWKNNSLYTDLARFEWAAIRALHAPDQLDQTERELNLHPSVQLMALHYNVMAKTKRSMSKRHRKPFYFAIYRNGASTDVATLAEAEWRMLHWLVAGSNLETLARKATKLKISDKALYKIFFRFSQLGLILESQKGQA